MSDRNRLVWKLGYSESAGGIPEEYVPAAIPGAVQLDMMAALELPDYTYANNVKDYRWMEDRYWHYVAEAAIDRRSDAVPFLVFESVEYRYDVFVNETPVCSGEGLYTPVSIDMSEYAGSSAAIRVCVHPAPKRRGITPQESEFSASCKPAFSYGWDWSPRMIALGIVGEAYIEYRPLNAVTDFQVSYALRDDLSAADIRLSFAQAQPSPSVRLRVLDNDGAPVLEEIHTPRPDAGPLALTLDHPALWWPAGQGSQPLYTILLEAEDAAGNVVHTVKKRIGFRRARLVMNDGEWERDMPFPCTQHKSPITLEINGRRIFAKGSNWVPPDLFVSRMTREVFETQLQLARDAHMNLLRVWGGGYVNSDVFYDLCDEYGLMVWQEFPLACASYSEEAAYLAVLEQEATSIIRRLRTHPGVVMWSGGNELFNYWSRMTNQSPALRLLNTLCYRHDPHTPFIPTSPLYGMGHGHYQMLSDGVEILTQFRHAGCTAYTEFGSAGPSPFAYIKEFIPEEERETLAPGGSYEAHHAVNAWRTDGDWFSREIIEHFFCRALSVGEAADQGAYLQGLMYRHLFEEARVQWPYCSMAVNWCFNEPWPTAAGNSLINYPARPKPAYAAVKNALRDRKACLRIEKLLWKTGELFEGEIWLLNSSPYPVPGGAVDVFLVLDVLEGQETHWMTWYHGTVEANRNLSGTRIAFPVPETGEFTIRLKSRDDPELDDSYTILCRSEAAEKQRTK